MANSFIAEDEIKQRMLEIFKTNEYAKSLVKNDMPNLDYETAFIKYRVVTSDNQFNHVLTVEEALKYEGFFTALIFSPIRPGSDIGFHSTMTLMCYLHCHEHLRIHVDNMSNERSILIDVRTGQIQHQECLDSIDQCLY
uniref:Uncharacterized protein n=1 Tax=Clandestinovirus TaxID=2831644 RepID=A0A8F8KNX8_9VIRU|nr:hypothetical protein KOM_12_121 [Clandestinovirus]